MTCFDSGKPPCYIALLDVDEINRGTCSPQHGLNCIGCGMSDGDARRQQFRAALADDPGMVDRLAEASHEVERIVFDPNRLLWEDLDGDDKMAAHGLVRCALRGQFGDPSITPAAVEMLTERLWQDQTITAQHDETTRLWSGRRGDLPARFHEVVPAVPVSHPVCILYVAGESGPIRMLGSGMATFTGGG